MPKIKIATCRSQECANSLVKKITKMTKMTKILHSRKNDGKVGMHQFSRLKSFPNRNAATERRRARGPPGSRPGRPPWPGLEDEEDDGEAVVHHVADGPARAVGGVPEAPRRGAELEQGEAQHLQPDHGPQQGALRAGEEAHHDNGARRHRHAAARAGDAGDGRFTVGWTEQPVGRDGVKNGGAQKARLAECMKEFKWFIFLCFFGPLIEQFQRIESENKMYLGGGLLRREGSKR